MSALTHLWLVRDPTATCGLVDVVWRQDVDSLDNYFRGIESLSSHRRTWLLENHAVYTDRDEAVGEAVRRMVAAGHDAIEVGRQVQRHFGKGAP